jgi:hypothetical protein
MIFILSDVTIFEYHQLFLKVFKRYLGMHPESKLHYTQTPFPLECSIFIYITWIG